MLFVRLYDPVGQSAHDTLGDAEKYPGEQTVQVELLAVLNDPTSQREQLGDAEPLAVPARQTAQAALRGPLLYAPPVHETQGEVLAEVA